MNLSLNLKNRFNVFKSYFNNSWVEFSVLIILAVINASYLFFYKYIPTLDGPQHLYNSNVIIEIFKGNDFVKDFFVINNVPVGYWLAHSILSVFNFIFPAWIANKLFLLLYLIITPIAFRYLVLGLNKKASYTPILIIPFLSHAYFFMGYYAFCIAWPVAFFVLGYFFRNRKQFCLKKYLIMALLFLLLYFSHFIVFVFTLIIIVFWLLFEFVWEVRFAVDKLSFFKRSITNAIKLFFSLIPALVLSIIYVIHVFQLNQGTGIAKINSLGFETLWDRFINLSVLVAFVHETESIWNVRLFWFFIMLTVFSLVYNMVFKRLKNKLNKIHVFWFFVTIIALLLYFLFPNTFGTGSVSNRIFVFFLFVFAIYLAVRHYPQLIKVGFILFVLLYSLGQNKVRQHSYQTQSNIIDDFMQIEKSMIPNSTYTGINTMNVWNDKHFGCYIGSEKSLVYLKSPQNLGHFPVVWNYEKAPKSYLGIYSKDNLNHNWFSGSDSGTIRPIDYVIVYGYFHFVNNEVNDNLRNDLLKYYELKAVSDYKYGAVYQFKLYDYIETQKQFIKSDPEWIQQIQKKAKIRGITEDDMLYLDILYMYAKP